ncbi:SAV_915 family protein [Streptomyces axinellae]|uniref:SseB protein N-terminal domain-containing protein n=1 Tax=Streptomyces axinellae TaxID=552788 RepID=A0ABN3QB98_9ACTN
MERSRPVGDLLFVPVRRGPGGCAGARLFRTPVGRRTAVGFTSERRLAAALGPAQPWLRLSRSALRSLVSPLGVRSVTVDPLLAGHAVRGPDPADKPLTAASSAAPGSSVAGQGPVTVRDFFPVQAARTPRREPSGAAGDAKATIPEAVPGPGPGTVGRRRSPPGAGGHAGR